MDDKQPVPASGWSFTPEEGASQQPSGAPQKAGESVSWTASEFIAHEKGAGWFAMFGACTALLTLLTYFVTKDIITGVVIVVVAIAFGAFAARKPRTLPYQIDSKGIHIDKKTYLYDSFKSFALIQEDGIRSILLIPLQRFMPPISLYMDPSDEDKILNVLADYLPLEQRQQDFVDRLMRRIRF